MTDHSTLFPLPKPLPDPTKVETHCPLCKRVLIFDKHGMAKHRSGDSRKCQEEAAIRWGAVFEGLPEVKR